MISTQNRFLLLKERSLLEESSFPTKSEDYLICLFFKNKYNININVNDVSKFINFNLICKTELLEFINNYFYMYQNELINKEIDFIFNTKDMWN